MNAETLKPCPFCGGGAEYERKGDKRQSTIVRCTMCGCVLESGISWDHWRDWNTRAADNIALQAEVERLREALEQLIAGYEVWDFDPSTQKLVRLPDEKQTSWIRQARAAINHKERNDDQ